MTATSAGPARSGAAAATRVGELLRDAAPLGVAFSGGVDSSVLLALAAQALGPENVVAILGISPSLAAGEREGAHAVADFVGVRLVEIETREGERAAYRTNGPDRCFHCKDELFTRISDEVVLAHGLAAVAYGENADDAARPDRPGARAAARHRVLRPLADAGLGKSAVRSIARDLGLPSADKPAAPCLASRIPHFQEVSDDKLRQVDQAETSLRLLGFGECRVRHHGDVARIEVPDDDLPRLVLQLRQEVRAAVRAAGFRFVSVDVGGLQSGAFTLPLVTGRHD